MGPIGNSNLAKITRSGTLCVPIMKFFMVY